MTDTLAIASPWDRLRAGQLSAELEATILAAEPDGILVHELTHIRTAHYVVCRVDTDHGPLVVRVGILDAKHPLTGRTGSRQVANYTPTGQHLENNLAIALAAAGAPAIPGTITHQGLFELLWLPHHLDTRIPATADQWHQALTAVHRWKPSWDLPIFTNRAKTMLRLDAARDPGAAAALRTNYDQQMEHLFNVASRWSLVHGDAHAGNILMTPDGLRLIDWDTACWAPTVWDITHLLNRAGTGDNTGYDPDILVRLFGFTPAEVDAAMALRRTAAQVARMVR